MKTVVACATTLLALATGCVWTPQAIKIRPDIEAISNSNGHGLPIQVSVADERSSSVLGTRGSRGVGAALTVEGDLATQVQSSVADGLARQSFAPAFARPPDGREIRVEIRSLGYGMTIGFMGNTLRTECSLKAICIRGAVRPYEQFYRGEYEENVRGVQTDSENDRFVNVALSKAINALLQDRQLTGCLAESEATSSAPP